MITWYLHYINVYSSEAVSPMGISPDSVMMTSLEGGVPLRSSIFSTISMPMVTLPTRRGGRQPGGFDGADEELGAVGAGAGLFIVVYP